MARLEGDNLDDIVDGRIIELGLIPAADGVDAVDVKLFLDPVAVMPVVPIQDHILML